MLDWLVYSAIGKLIIFIIQSFPLPEKIEEHWFFGKLHRCDLCLGVWVFSIMAFFLKIDALQSLGFWYVPVLSEIVTGMATSFVVHLWTLGWKEKFSNPIII